MTEIWYLTLSDVVSLHGLAMERCGSPHSPLIQPQKLESAIARPRALAHYEEADLARQAVALAIGISQSQAFLDGNKRAAFASLYVFLRVNGLEYVGPSDPICQWIEDVAGASRELRSDLEVNFSEWLQAYLVPPESL